MRDYKLPQLALTLLLIFLFLRIPLFSEFSRDKIIHWQKGIVYCNYHSKSVTTGFFVSDDGIIVAPLHLVQDWIIFVDGFHIFVTTYDKNKIYKAEVMGFNQNADVLFLKISYKPEVWFRDFTQAQNGMKCIALGYPYGWRTGIEAKIITHYREEWLGIDRIPVEGSSGSLILSEEGKVLGMLTKRYGLGFIVPSIIIKNGLMQINVKTNSDL